MSKTENLLLTLAYCWYLDRNNIHQLHYPDSSLKHVQDVLTSLNTDELIVEHRWSSVISVRTPDSDTLVKRTIRQPSMWQLSDKGHRAIQHLPAYPNTFGRKRPRQLFPHDSRTNAAIVHIIKVARTYGLSGLNIQREVKLDPNPKVRRPVIDALVIFETGGDYSKQHPELLPWSSDRHLQTEALYRIAIEADNDTEPGQVIAAKAGAYQKVLATPAWVAWWRERYGHSVPAVMWVAPNQVRAQAIVRHWEQAWPQGQWLVTADEELKGNSWTYHANNTTQHNMAIGFPDQPVAPQQHRSSGRLSSPGVTNEWEGVSSLGASIARARRLTRADYDREQETARVKDELDEQRRKEFQERAEAERQRAEECAANERREAEERAAQAAIVAAAQAEQERRIQRARRYRPWWWAYWTLCGMWRVIQLVMRLGGVIGRVLGRVLGAVLRWWLDCLIESERPEHGIVRWVSGALLIWGLFWLIPIVYATFPQQLPTTEAAEAIVASAPTPATCGALTPQVPIPLRAEPHLAAPELLPTRMAVGQVVEFLCETAQSSEQLQQQGQRATVTITWAKLRVDAVVGWANMEFLETP